jgi:ankyrin repeat protein
LDETYERILCHIEDYYQDYALRILRWLVFSPRPLTVLEIAETIAIDIDGDGCFNEDEVLPEPLDVVTICSSLVTTVPLGSEERIIMNDDGSFGLENVVVASTDISKISVRLAHYSVQEYLVSERIISSTAGFFHLQSEPSHAVIAQSCLVYLLRLRNPDMEYKALNSAFPLARYAAQFWWTHFREASEAHIDKSCHFAETLFARNADAFPISIRLYNPKYGRHTWYLQYRDIQHPLFYSTVEGIRILVQIIICRLDLSKNVELCWAALCVSADIGHAEIFKIIFKAEEKIPWTDKNFNHLLSTSVRKEQNGNVEILLAAGANANAKDTYEVSLLSVASANGYERIVEMLIAAGADVNADDNSSRALYFASGNGYERIVEILIAAGADINAASERGSALTVASKHGHERIVEILIAAGADYANSKLGTALHFASQKGYQRIVEMLIAAGADINAASELGSALTVASRNGREQIVEILIAAGADINAASELGSALTVASKNGYERIVEILIAAGADINANSKLGSALTGASHNGRERIVEILIAGGADVNANSEIGTALHLASQNGYQRIVEMLIAAGADINTDSDSVVH